jgi:integrase/recombinase XerD
MSRQKRKRTIQVASVAPLRMRVLMDEYLTWLGLQNFSGDTVRTFSACIGYFLEWCGERSIEDVTQVTRPVLERYQRSLYHYRKKAGAPLTFRTQNGRLRALKGWFRWLARQNYLLHNPASELVLPRLENRLPKHVLNLGDVEAILRQPDVATVVGLRDRAILETFYATGMRRMEVTGLKLYDIDQERGTVMIRLGNREEGPVCADQRTGASVDRKICGGGAAGTAVGFGRWYGVSGQ